MAEIWNPLGGGALIGVAVSLMLYLNGRIAGVSGITNGIFTAKRSDRAWRVSFVTGLLSGGVALFLLNPGVLVSQISSSVGQLVVAGLLVGFGAVVGNGCTSGHGVCGITRLSPRSIVATLTFILSGMITVFLMKSNFAGLL